MCTGAAPARVALETPKDLRGNRLAFSVLLHLMVARVSRPRIEQHEVLDPVVGAVMVDVVNNLLQAKRATY